MKPTKPLLLPLLAALPASLLPAQMAGTYLIDPSVPGVFQSFTEAVNAMFVQGVSGPVQILVAPGTYTESVLVPPITGASPTNTVRFEALAGPGTVLLGGANGDTFALLGVAFRRNSSIGWKGIEFTGGPGHAISGTTFVEDLEISHCTFREGHRSNATGEFRHSILTSENSSSELGWKVHHNHFTLSSQTNRTSYAIYLSNGGEWDIHHNTFDMNGASYGLYMINNNRRIDRVYNNLFVGTTFNTTSTSFNTVAVIRADISNYENYFTHNTFAVTFPGTGACIATGGFTSGATGIGNYIFGNVFFVLGGGVALTVGATSGVAQPFQADGNVYFCPGTSVARLNPAAAGTSYPTLAGWQTAVNQDLNSIETDPQLQQPLTAPFDLRPIPGSPVAGAARNTPSYVTTDFAGRLRDATPDAGAYESTSFALYGEACIGNNSLAPAFGSSGSVALGSPNFRFEVSQAAPFAVAVLYGGLSRTSAGATPLPFPLGGGCAILAEPLSLNLLLTNGSGDTSLPYPLPGSVTLSGVNLYFQVAVVDPASGSSFGITTTAGGALQL